MKERKPLKVPQVLQPIVSVKAQSRFVMDLINMQQYSAFNDGKEYIMTVVDHFSCFLWAFPLKHKKAKSVRKKLEQLFKQEGAPDLLQSDNGGEFKAKKIRDLCDTWGVKIANSAAYSPNVNGKVER